MYGQVGFCLSCEDAIAYIPKQGYGVACEQAYACFVSALRFFFTAAGLL